MRFPSQYFSRSRNFWSLPVEAVRYCGGYGRMSWIECSDWTSAQPDPLVPFAAGLLDHMNSDHAETMVLYCRTFSRATDTSAARMTCVDRYGFEMSAVTAEGPRPVRLAFPEPICTSDQARKALIAMLEAARSKLK